MTKYHALFIRQGSFWFLDCSSWDRQEILQAFHEYVTPIRDKRVITIASDSWDELSKARHYLHSRNTKTFVDLSRGF